MSKIVDKLKKIKIVWDTITIARKIFLLLATFTGIGSYFANDIIDYMSDAEPVAQVTPEYALKAHTHKAAPVPDYKTITKEAITTFENSHDPSRLGH